MLIGWATTAQGQTSASDQPVLSPATSVDTLGVIELTENCTESVWKILSQRRRYYMHAQTENEVLSMISV